MVGNPAQRGVWGLRGRGHPKANPREGGNPKRQRPRFPAWWVCTDSQMDRHTVATQPEHRQSPHKASWGACNKTPQLRGLKEQKFIPSQPGGQKSDFEVQAGRAPRRGSGEASAAGLSHLLASLAVLGLQGHCPTSVPIAAWLLPPRLRSLLLRTPVAGLRAHSNLIDLI